MSYSFKDEVVKRLPVGHRFVRIYPSSNRESIVETVKDAIKQTLRMKKVDLASYFSQFPTFSVRETETFNDLYKRISARYGLGLEMNLDYYDSRPVRPTSVTQYVELPIKADSYGYYGVIRCNVILDALAGDNVTVKRDATETTSQTQFNYLKVRTYFMSKPFTTDLPLFVEDRLSVPFIEAITADMDREVYFGWSDFYKGILAEAVIEDVFNDGLSDILVVRTHKDIPFFIRFSGELPLIKNNEDIDTETDTSKEVLVGSEDSVAENPVEGKGELLYTAERSDIPTEVVTPEETTTPTKKARKKKN